MKDAPLLNLALSIALFIMIGWLLVVGRGLLLPIFTAIISLYLMVSAAKALALVPGLGRLPPIVLRLIVLVIFLAAAAGCAMVVVSTVEQILALLPQYQQNLRELIVQLAGLLGVEPQWLWSTIVAATARIVDLGAVSATLLGGFASVGTTISLIVIYTVFLFGERVGFAAKLAAALPRSEHSERTMEAITEMNRQIGRYLFIKSLINVILGVICYGVLWVMDVNFALFWAIVIAFLNYIPYAGSLLGVLFPVGLSVIQFGSVVETTILAVLLVTAQTFVGNVLEPRWIGRELNLSPFVVIVALSLWAAIWGLPGAILAIPLTSILAIIFSSFESTRFLAILMAERVPKDRRPTVT